ncbi:uncharacterized protein N7473_011087 [Penicillium subrubescens]|uniref:uncharacterized protein n=1 Tax=Penicillium subrubescens TaxID=1316194 RepID=UPI002544E217|nr:uncharacterized protein N7473_011087 [Penicillium subrubescens]KAJ5882825.1 hypothetical protein N7473_011087 [Penicillium subrubescens]
MTLLPPLVPTARVLTFAYNEYEADWQHVILQEFILDGAGDLLSSLQRTERTTAQMNDRSHLSAMVLVNSSTHSEPTFRNVFLSTRGVIFLGTPFNGSGLASWLQSVSDSVGLNKQGCFDSINFLKESSNLILDQNLRHLDIIKKKSVQMGFSPIEFTCFNEGLSLDFDSIVPKESATPPRCPDVGIHRNQVDMTKITNADDPLFKAIGGKLRQWISNADAKIIYHGSSSLAKPLRNAHQKGDYNRQYNLFG